MKEVIKVIVGRTMIRLVVFWAVVSTAFVREYY